MFRLIEQTQLHVEIKKSQFIATCVPILNEGDARTAMEMLRRPDATHHCWAYRLGHVYRFNDDGEPGGSAGRPILAAIDGQEFDNVLAHVVRYFGGIKLGVGGLVRAYGNTVAKCLQNAPKEQIVLRKNIRFCVDFADSYAIHGLIEQRHLIKVDESYTESGVCFELGVEAAQIPETYQKLNDLTRARIRWIERAE